MLNQNEMESKILGFWEKNKIYEKSRKRNSRGEKFYFMDGPPYASGHIHMGTALNKILKDIAMRSKRLQGRNVFDRPGYDTHGVPIEFQVEKEIGTKNKQDIEKFGVGKFVALCKEYATKYIDVMNAEFSDLGVWMDWEAPYLTLNDEYTEAIWNAFKSAEKKGLLYLGAYPVHVCPRCETAVAYNEIEYSKQKDVSIYVKFPLENKKNTFLLIWTTTPWTLPGNTGVMVHPDVVYQEIEVSNGEHWIIAKELVPKVMATLERGFTLKKEFKGKDMADWTYTNPLSENLNLDLDESAYRVVLSSRYVTTEEGSGLVHTAPGHGKEDYEVGKETGLPAVCPVETSGLLTEEAGKYAGKKARIVDEEIIADLEKDGFLVHKLEYTHDYPFCWRDKEPLLMVSIPQWFLKISEIQKKLIAENEKVNWIPKFMQLRMKAWLSGISDWPVSRQRYWGTPLPIWVNSDGERIVIGSLNELKKLSGKQEIDVHKPGIDSIVFEKDGKEYHRVSEVLDVWFDSGVSSWAALDYMISKSKFKKFWPADLNIEGKDQFRGWWNSQLILSEIAFGKKPFRNILVHGLVLDVEKSKMSKSKGNIVKPDEVIENYGRDYLRYYFAKTSKGEDFAFDETELKELRKVFTILININSYVNQLKIKIARNRIEDTWIKSRFNSMLEDVTVLYDSFRFPEVVQRLERFLINDLSRTYIQLTRDRADETAAILSKFLNYMLILYAPIIPFLTEHLWLQNNKKSIHLSSWPRFNARHIHKELEKEFEIALRIVEAGLFARDKAKIGLRWPLAIAEVSLSSKISKDVQAVIAQQLNVKSIKLKKSKGPSVKVKLDTKLTPDLEAEGFTREISRKIQAERKKAGLKKGDLIVLKLSLPKDLEKGISKHLEFLKERTNSERIQLVQSKTKISFEVKDKIIGIEF